MSPIAIRTVFRALLLSALCVAVAGCATTDDSENYARLQTSDARIPVIYARKVMILSIDGQEFGSQFSSIRVPPGYHEAHIVFMECAFPILVVTCLEGAREEIVPFEADAGVVYTFDVGARSTWIVPVDLLAGTSETN